MHTPWIMQNTDLGVPTGLLTSRDKREAGKASNIQPQASTRVCRSGATNKSNMPCAVVRKYGDLDLCTVSHSALTLSAGTGEVGLSVFRGLGSGARR